MTDMITSAECVEMKHEPMKFSFSSNVISIFHKTKNCSYSKLGLFLFENRNRRLANEGKGHRVRAIEHLTGVKKFWGGTECCCFSQSLHNAVSV